MCFGRGGAGSYLAFKKNSLEPNEGFIPASLYKPLLGNILFTAFQLVLANGAAKVENCRTPCGTAPLLWISLILSFPGRLRVPPKHSWGVVPRQTSLCSMLPSCSQSALYSSHCSTNVTIVSLPGTLRMRKSHLPLGGREDGPFAHLKC